MHLNDGYDAIRGHILLLDHLPPINKANSMIQRVEKQRQVAHNPGMSKEVNPNANRITSNLSVKIELGADFLNFIFLLKILQRQGEIAKGLRAHCFVIIAKEMVTQEINISTRWAILTSMRDLGIVPGQRNL